MSLHAAVCNAQQINGSAARYVTRQQRRVQSVYRAASAACWRAEIRAGQHTRATACPYRRHATHVTATVKRTNTVLKKTTRAVGSRSMPQQWHVTQDRDNAKNAGQYCRRPQQRVDAA
ncbi:hypothetical protein TNCT_435611 [Trichonephila clavata]|uniref:Uncharacterized protein n=1 Tax=Trichonephila clavata TaxID=2740835 RepID=A0A8X6LKE8_TRICU|nr:hypothetical protein TNCT_435611 [Trichonephila clavata]